VHLVNENWYRISFIIKDHLSVKQHVQETITVRYNVGLFVIFQKKNSVKSVGLFI
jgi:hypothetical protein